MEYNYMVEMTNIKKRFSGVKALNGVALKVFPGEVHALMGENGAGKSTLMKILGGAYVLDEGTIKIEGKKISIKNPIESAQAGIAVIYQEQSLINSLSVADNIMLGRIPSKGGWIDSKKQCEIAQEALKTVEADIELTREVGTLSVAQRQFVEIAKAVSMQAKIIVMDEPSSVLTLSETRHMFKLIRELKAQGKSIIYISHRMEEIFEISDRCTVLKDGEYVGTVDTDKIDRIGLIKMMTGREIADIYPKRNGKGIASEVFRVERLCKKNVFENVSFSVKAGEIVGMSGLVGSGRTEVCRAIMGIDRIDSGDILLNGEKLKIKAPRDAIDAGLMYISEDRKEDGMVLELPIETNITLTTVGRYAKCGFIDKKKERAAIQKMIDLLSVKCAGVHQKVGDLSGGNQQKVMLANGILVGATVMIIDEPTRGVDVGTKSEIYKIIKRIAGEGTAIIMISSELPEILGMSDRVLVMHRGSIAAEIDGDEATEENILMYATGGN